MKQIIISGILSLLAILLIPSGQAVPEAEAAPRDRVLCIIESTDAQESPAASSAPVRLLCGDTVIEQDEQEYLCCVLLCEMPASFEPEALAAQAVAARTFLRRQMQGGKHENADVCMDSACCQAWCSESALRERFGAEYDAYMQKALRAVERTQDEVLTYDGALIDATYFSCSGGRTEDALAVWGTDVPYLRSVESFGEEAAPRYESTVRLTPDELSELLTAADSTLTLPENPAEWFGEASCTAGGGVDTCQIGSARFSGVQLRRILSLNSTQFTVRYDGGVFVFDVLGFGHRVGMSQYGANFMAQQGWSYRRILEYYYRGVTLETQPRS